MPQNLHRPSLATCYRLLLIVLLALAALPLRSVSAATIVYVKPGGVSNGTSWANAADLEPALAAVASGTEIWVAKGTYRPAISSRAASFRLTSGVAIYGGFSGTETLRSQRSLDASLTILSGDLQNDDSGAITTSNPTRADNSYHVVTGNNTDATAVLDGVTIRSGNANGTNPDDGGGGMLATTGLPTISNIVFRDNSASSGGGIFNSSSDPAVTNVTFSGNSATHYGGGLYNTGGNPTLTNVTFSGNSAGTGGGGLYNLTAGSTLTNVTFSGNSASAGGGLHNDDSSPTLTNVTFSGNSAQDTGGGLFNINSNPTLTNVAFSGNSATNEGGGLSNISSNPTLTNVIFSGNSGFTGGGVYNTNNSPSLTNVTFSGNSATSGGGGLFNNNSSPSLTNVTVSGNSATSQGGGILNTAGSTTAFRNTLLAGNSSSASSPDCLGAQTSGGYNLVGNNSGCTFTAATGDKVGTAATPLDPKLGPLQENGGFAPTRALLAGSLALNAIPSGVNGCGTTIASDERGVPRPQGTHCDIGAYEAIPQNTASTTAGAAGQPGSADGLKGSARFDAPSSIAAAANGTLALIADTGNHTIRQIDIKTGLVTTLAGKPDVPGSTNGITNGARFREPYGIALTANGRMALVADTGNNTIRKIDMLSGRVTTLAGTAIITGSTDAYTTSARFNQPIGIALDAGGTLALVSDYGNHTIRKIDLVTLQVTTLAGSAGAAGNQNGTGKAARFNHPTGVAVSADGKIALVADTGNNTIRKIVVATGQVTTLAVVTTESRITPSILDVEIQGIAMDADGCTGMVANSSTHTITKVDVATGRLNLIAGSPGSAGSANGSGTNARFDSPKGLALANDSSTALVADTQNNTIRRVDGIAPPKCQRIFLPLVRR